MKKISLAGMTLCILFLTGCFALNNHRSVFEPTPDIIYIEHYRPLLVISTNIYKEAIDKQKFTEIIKEMDRQAINSEEVNIYESLILLLQIVNAGETPKSIPKEEAIIALNSLEVINEMYGSSPIVEAIYPKLKKTLKLFEYSR